MYKFLGHSCMLYTWNYGQDTAAILHFLCFLPLTLPIAQYIGSQWLRPQLTTCIRSLGTGQPNTHCLHLTIETLFPLSAPLDHSEASLYLLILEGVAALLTGHMLEDQCWVNWDWRLLTHASVFTVSVYLHQPWIFRIRNFCLCGPGSNPSGDASPGPQEMMVFPFSLVGQPVTLGRKQKNIQRGNHLN